MSHFNESAWNYEFDKLIKMGSFRLLFGAALIAIPALVSMLPAMSMLSPRAEEIRLAFAIMSVGGIVMCGSGLLKMKQLGEHLASEEADGA